MNDEDTNINEPSQEGDDGTPEEGVPTDRRPLGYWLRTVDGLHHARVRRRLRRRRRHPARLDAAERALGRRRAPAFAERFARKGKRLRGLERARLGRGVGRRHLDPDRRGPRRQGAARRDRGRHPLARRRRRLAPRTSRPPSPRSRRSPANSAGTRTHGCRAPGFGRGFAGFGPASARGFPSRASDSVPARDSVRVTSMASTDTASVTPDTARATPASAPRATAPTRATRITGTAHTTRTPVTATPDTASTAITAAASAPAVRLSVHTSAASMPASLAVGPPDRRAARPTWRETATTGHGFTFGPLQHVLRGRA